MRNLLLIHALREEASRALTAELDRQLAEVEAIFVAASEVAEQAAAEIARRKAERAA